MGAPGTGSFYSNTFTDIRLTGFCISFISKLVFLFLQSTTHPRSNPISISGKQSFGGIPRRQNSIEALNKEIEYISNCSIASESRVSCIMISQCKIF